MLSPTCFRSIITDIMQLGIIASVWLMIVAYDNNCVACEHNSCVAYDNSFCVGNDNFCVAYNNSFCVACSKDIYATCNSNMCNL